MPGGRIKKPISRTHIRKAEKLCIKLEEKGTNSMRRRRKLSKEILCWWRKGKSSNLMALFCR
jgi:hypothetical protein